MAKFSNSWQISLYNLDDQKWLTIVDYEYCMIYYMFSTILFKIFILFYMPATLFY